MEEFVRQAREFRKTFGATKLLITTPDAESLEPWLSDVDIPVLIASPDPKVRDLEDPGDDIEILPLGYRVGGGINALKQLRDVLLTAYVAGRIHREERLAVVQLGEESGYGLLALDMAHDESVAKLRKDLEYRADVGVVEEVLQIATDLAREGRESSKVGAVFIIGDTDRVLRHSRQIVLNPFEGHPPQARTVLDPRNWETVKEFAQIDGAIIIRDDGVIEAAGRYVEVRDPTDLPPGLGGRHLAAAAITTETKAIAITLSETGVIHIFRDGKSLLRIGVT